MFSLIDRICYVADMLYRLLRLVVCLGEQYVCIMLVMFSQFMN